MNQATTFPKLKKYWLRSASFMTWSESKGKYLVFLLDNLLELVVSLLAKFTASKKQVSEPPKSILVLRNNDLGDLLVITPIFEALHKKFPDTQIIAAVGSWNVETLKNNPYISEIIEINAPWFNRFVQPQSFLDALRYIYFSSEVQKLALRKFDVGIDILGSHFGALLLLQATIPYRLGVNKYAGGYSGMQDTIIFDPYQHVGYSALKFAEKLGATELPEVRPQIFLTPDEIKQGIGYWSDYTKRIIVTPGGGFPEKCWPLDYYQELIKLMLIDPSVEIIIVGGKQDIADAAYLVIEPSRVHNLAGKLKLRETYSVLKHADLALCNTSMLMHAAAAFHIPSLVLLGECCDSATQHHAQWGYQKTCYILGKDIDRLTIYKPDEVIVLVTKLLSPTNTLPRMINP